MKKLISSFICATLIFGTVANNNVYEVYASTAVNEDYEKIQDYYDSILAVGHYSVPLNDSSYGYRTVYVNWAIKDDGALWYIEYYSDGNVIYKSKILDNVVQVYKFDSVSHDVVALKNDNSLWDVTTCMEDKNNPKQPVKLIDDVKTVHLYYGDWPLAILNDDSLWEDFDVDGPFRKLFDNVTSIQSFWWDDCYIIQEDGTLWYRSSINNYLEKVPITDVYDVDYEAVHVIKNDGSLWICDNSSELLENRTYSKLFDDVVEVNEYFAKTSDDTLWTLVDFTEDGENIVPKKIANNVAAFKTIMRDDCDTTYILQNDGVLLESINPHDFDTINEPVKVLEDVAYISDFFSPGQRIDIAYALKTDGTLWSWEYNDGTPTSPIKILDNVDGFKEISGTAYAIKNDGTLWKFNKGESNLPVKIFDNVALYGNDSSVHEPIPDNNTDTDTDSNNNSTDNSNNNTDNSSNSNTSNTDSTDDNSNNDSSSNNNSSSNSTNNTTNDTSTTSTTSNSTDINKLTDTVNNLSNTVNNLNNKVDNLTDSVGNLNNKVDNIPNTTTTSAKSNTTGTNTSTTSNYSVKYNGVTQNFKPIVKNGTSYIPARQLVENMFGGKITWNKSNSQIKVVINGATMVFTPNSKTYTYNGKKVTTNKNAGTFVQNGTTYVPVRFICEAFGMKVGYDKTSNTITIKDKVINNYLNLSEGEQKYYISQKTGYSANSLVNCTTQYIKEYGVIDGEHTQLYKYTAPESTSNSVEYLIALSKDGTITQKTIIPNYKETLK